MEFLDRKSTIHLVLPFFKDCSMSGYLQPHNGFAALSRLKPLLCSCTTWERLCGCISWWASRCSFFIFPQHLFFLKEDVRSYLCTQLHAIRMEDAKLSSRAGSLTSQFLPLETTIFKKKVGCRMLCKIWHVLLLYAFPPPDSTFVWCLVWEAG